MVCAEALCQTVYMLRPGRVITCGTCRQLAHPECLGLGPHAFLGGFFQCADCVLFEAALPNRAGDFSKAAEAAHSLVQLVGSRCAVSSQATYASALSRYVAFSQQALRETPAEALPADPRSIISTARVMLFVAWAGGKYKINTIKLTLSALAEWHKSKGASAESVNDRRVHEVVQALSVRQGPEGLPAGKTGMSKALLITLIDVIGTLQEQSPRMAALYDRDRAWLLLGFFGFLRRSEIVALCLQDIQLHRDHLEVLIRKSKNDRVGKGVAVCIAYINASRILIRAPLQSFVNHRRKQGAKADSPLFSKWDLDHFQLSDSALANGQALAARLKTYLMHAQESHPGLTINVNSYGMHSLRRGGVTAAWEAGMDVSKLKAHGRWKSEAIRVYLEATLPIKLSVTQCI